jgi:hypothetical protein
MADTIYKPASPEIIFEEFDGDLVVLNMTSGQYFGFNTSAAAVWAAMMSGVSPADLAGIGPDEGAIASFVDKLMTLELIIPDPETKPVTTTLLGEAEKAAMVENPSAPVVEVYDDLADLIVADPIHDVDQEAGWPHMPASD